MNRQPSAPLRVHLRLGLPGRPNRAQRPPLPPRRLLQTSTLAGFQYHQGEQFWSWLKPGHPLRLLRERTNPHDPRAVAVYWLDAHLGYLPRGENAAAAQLLDQGRYLVGRIVQLQESPDPWQRIGLEVYLEVAEVIP
jgi:hypothetical protein